MRSGGILLLGLGAVLSWSTDARAQAPANDDFPGTSVSNADLPYTDFVDTTQSTTQNNEPISCGSGPTVWYTFTATADATLRIDTLGSDYDTVLAAYTGSSVDALTFVDCNDDWYDLQSRLALDVTSGDTVRIQVSNAGGATGGNLQFNIDEVVQPPNDDFADATLLSEADLPFTDIQATNLATTETGEPDGNCNGSGGSVWYAFTPTVDTTVAFDTFRSQFDTVLAAYTGTSLGDLVLVDCNDDTIGTQSLLALSLPADQTVYIQANGYTGSTGEIVVDVDTLTPVANDDFANATALTEADLPFADSVDTSTAASVELGEPQGNCNGSGPSVWYTFTPGADITVHLDTVGSDYFTSVSVYTGTALDDLSLVACADGNTNSQIDLDAFAGETLFVQVNGGYDGVGSLVFDLGQLDTDGDGVPDPVDNCPSTYNPDQTDTDGDGLGDACDPESIHDLAIVRLRSNNPTIRLAHGTTASLRATVTVQNQGDHLDAFDLFPEVSDLPSGCTAGAFTGDLSGSAGQGRSARLTVRSDITCDLATPVGDYPVFLDVLVDHFGNEPDIDPSDDFRSAPVTLKVR